MIVFAPDLPHANGCPGPVRVRLATFIGALVVLALAAAGARADDRQIAVNRASEPRTFSDAQIIDGFFKVVFGAEFHTEGRIDRIRKYDGPIRVYIDNQAVPDRRAQLGRIITDIRDHVNNLDIAVTTHQNDANMLVTLVYDRDLAKTISLLYGSERARKIQSSLQPQCLSGFRKDENYRIVHSVVILVVDAGEFTFLDCAYEEILQALGPINDDRSVPWTMFNDDVQLGFFGLYDQYLLNLLYHTRVRPGMTRQQVSRIIPEIMPEVRTFVSRTPDQ